MSGKERRARAKVAVEDSVNTLDSSSAMAACLRAQTMSRSRSGLSTFFGLSPLSISAADLYSAALSELETAVALAALGGEWMVADSSQRAADAVTTEHLVIGPSGAFLVTSAPHPNARVATAGRMVVVDGRRVAYVRSALKSAAQITTSLESLGVVSVAVRPLVVIIGASRVTSGRVRAPVPVLQLGELVRWLLHQPNIYSAAEVKALVATAAHLESWQVRPAADSARVRLAARFERLRTEVDAAHRRHRLSIVIGITGAIAATGTGLMLAAPALAGLFTG